MSAPKTMEQRKADAQAALLRDIEAAQRDFEILMIPKYLIPKGAKLCECYETPTQFVVIGKPNDCKDENDPSYHNCDAMGCSSISHVIARFSKP